jgi:signal transduction histidine kinase
VGGRQIARELHDRAGQTLAALSTDVARISENAKKDPAQFARDVQNAEELVQHLTQEIRITSYLLIHRRRMRVGFVSTELVRARSRGAQ